ncbi:MAG: hypothetical protein ACYSU0_20985 [Planctomycetota bacterium]
MRYLGVFTHCWLVIAFAGGCAQEGGFLGLFTGSPVTSWKLVVDGKEMQSGTVRSPSPHLRVRDGLANHVAQLEISIGRERVNLSIPLDAERQSEFGIGGSHTTDEGVTVLFLQQRSGDAREPTEVLRTVEVVFSTR